MAKYTKPDMSIQWAQAGTLLTPNDTKKQTGWVVEKPAFEFMNWLQNRQDTALAYTFQMGVPEWDSSTEYQYSASAVSYIQYNGIVYKAIQTGTNKQPTTETGYWTRAFDDYGSAATVNSALNTHITNYGTLASLSNVTTARSNLSVYSIAECNSTFAPIAGNSSQTFLVGSATSANHAVRKSQFDAKTGQATETTAGIMEVATQTETDSGVSDTVAVTPLKFKTGLDNRNASTSATGLVELATDAETITGTDSARATTPSNLTALFNGTGRQSLGSSGYQKLPGGLIIQWGYGLLTNASTVSFPIAFPTACVHVGISPDAEQSVGVEAAAPAAYTTTTFKFYGTVNGSPSALTCSWFAIGY